MLGVDMSLNMLLPCRISIYADKGKTLLGMVLPTALLALISTDPAIAAAAQAVERTMQANARCRRSSTRLFESRQRNTTTRLPIP